MEAKLNKQEDGQGGYAPSRYTWGPLRVRKHFRTGEWLITDIWGNVRAEALTTLREVRVFLASPAGEALAAKVEAEMRA